MPLSFVFYFLFSILCLPWSHQGHSRTQAGSEWAIGFNRDFGSVCSVYINFGFQKSRADRFLAKSKTDEIGFGFIGLVSRFHRTDSKERGEN